MKRKYWILLIICVWILSVDQWTKYAVQQRLPLHRRVEVVPGFFNLTHVRNTGGAFGILGGKRGGWGLFFFVAVSLVAIGSILFLFVKTKEDGGRLPLAFALVLSGALGNLIDRLRYGEVIDFLEFYVSSFYWPAFNIADSAICVGIGLLVLELIIHDRQGKKNLL